MIISPYTSTYGKMLNNENTKKEILKYISTNSDLKLNYEFIVEDCRLVVITGFNTDEKELPIFDHIIIMKDLKGKDVVCVDLRKYVKTHAEQSLYLKDVIKDISVLNFIMLRTLVTIDFLQGNTGTLANVEKNFCTGFTLFLSNILALTANLNPVEKLNIEVIIAYYFYAQFYDVKDFANMKSTVIAKIAKTNLSLPVNIKIVESLVTDEMIMDSLDNLMLSLKIVVGDDKKDLLNLNVLTNNLSSVWYGPGGSEAMMMSLDHIPTWIALMHSACTDNTYKRSRLSMMLDKVSNKIKVQEVEKSVELYLKERVL